MSEVVSYPNMRKVVPAFWVLNLLVRCRNGRRRQRLERMARTVVHTPEPGNSARVVAMPPRSERRARVKVLRADAKRRQPELNRRKIREAMPFRPVYGHALPTKEPHVDAIATLKTKDHDIAAKWAEKQAVAKLMPQTKAAYEQMLAAADNAEVAEMNALERQETAAE